MPAELSENSLQNLLYSSFWDVVCTCNFVDPLLEVCEGDSVGDVEDDDDAVRVPVARRQHRTVTLLPASVPNLNTRLRDI